MNKMTPWGISDDSGDVLAEGIISYSTPSHGGIWLSDERMKQIPATAKNFLGNFRWWEEDCDWVVPYIIFKDDIKEYGTAYKFDENLLVAYGIAKHFHNEIL